MANKVTERGNRGKGDNTSKSEKFRRFSDTPIHPLFGSVPFPRSYWVVPGKLLAGCYPGSEDDDGAHRKLKGLLDHGIRHVINLMEPDEFNWDRKTFVPYEIQMKSIAESMGLNVTFERIPIKDMNIPSRINMIKILDRIDESIERGRPVYIHCPALLNSLR